MYYSILQVYRGLAAMMVVLHHLMNSFSYYSNCNLPALERMGAFGKLGVDFFFILSGFIISYANHNKKDFKTYLLNRSLRIYIPYLPIGMLMYLLYVVVLLGVSNGERDISLLHSITLFPYKNPALSVAWTLSYEMCFYILFGLSFISKKVWHFFLLGWLISILIFNYVYPVEYGMFILLSPYNLEFMLGYILSVFIIRKISLVYVTVFLLGIGMMSLLNEFDFNTNIVFATCMAILIYLSVKCLNIAIDRKNIFMLIGNASFSIYLTHSICHSAMIRWMPGYLGVFSLPVIIILCLLVGYLYYIAFEKKLTTYFKNKLIHGNSI